MLVHKKRADHRPVPVPAVEEHPYDAAFQCTSNHKTYVFIGDVYYRVEGRHVEQGYPKPIEVGWPGIPPRVDAVFEGPEADKIYFFKGDKFWRYTKTTETVDPGYPKPIIEQWEGKAVTQPPIPELGQLSPVVVLFHGGLPHLCPQKSLPVSLPSASSTNSGSSGPIAVVTQQRSLGRLLQLLALRLVGGPGGQAVVPHCPHVHHPPTLTTTLLQVPSTLTDGDVEQVDRFLFGLRPEPSAQAKPLEVSPQAAGRGAEPLPKATAEIPVTSSRTEMEEEKALDEALMTHFL
eukprot:RCo019663